MTGNVYPASFITSEAMRDIQAAFNQRYSDMADAMLVADRYALVALGAEKPTLWRRALWWLKQPLWAAQDWICRHVCSCGD